MSIRYSDQLALMMNGKLYCIGSPMSVINSINLQKVFNVDVQVIDTPIGLQVLPICSSSFQV